MYRCTVASLATDLTGTHHLNRTIYVVSFSPATLSENTSCHACLEPLDQAARLFASCIYVQSLIMNHSHRAHHHHHHLYTTISLGVPLPLSYSTIPLLGSSNEHTFPLPSTKYARPAVSTFLVHPAGNFPNRSPVLPFLGTSFLPLNPPPPPPCKNTGRLNTRGSLNDTALLARSKKYRCPSKVKRISHPGGKSTWDSNRSPGGRNQEVAFVVWLM